MFWKKSLGTQCYSYRQTTSFEMAMEVSPVLGPLVSRPNLLCNSKRVSAKVAEASVTGHFRDRR